MPQNWRDISKPATVNGSNEHSNDRETSLMMNSNGRETSLLQPSVFTNLVSSEESCSNLAALRSFVALVSLGKCRTKTEDEDKLMIMHYSDQIFHERYNEKSTLLSWRLCIYSKEPPLTIQSPFDDSHPVESRFKNSADGETEDVFPDCVARKTEQIETYRVEMICGINARDDESASNGAADVIESNKTESIPNFRVSLMKVVVERWRSGGRVMVSYGGDGRVKSQGGGVATTWL
ncbi:hypothetical protein Bca52824_026078 [Brassica carinata]|uniref:Uncharacterized protein n=1 Tax=Brassica carinata TaxID=52824 RepID=A0A8X7V7J6_BRACI|nr:hypothetical protein Bca52824_026078 [Brassica carinata]